MRGYKCNILGAGTLRERESQKIAPYRDFEGIYKWTHLKHDET